MLIELCFFKSALSNSFQTKVTLVHEMTYYLSQNRWQSSFEGGAPRKPRPFFRGRQLSSQAFFGWCQRSAKLYMAIMGMYEASFPSFNVFERCSSTKVIGDFMGFPIYHPPQKKAIAIQYIGSHFIHPHWFHQLFKPCTLRFAARKRETPKGPEDRGASLWRKGTHGDEETSFRN